MIEVVQLNELLSQVPYSDRIEIDFSSLEGVANAIPMGGNDKKILLNQYIVNQLGPDAPILQYSQFF